MQAARALTLEMQSLCDENAGREDMCNAMMGDIERANATIAAHTQAADNLKGYVTQLQARNAELGALASKFSRKRGFNMDSFA